MHAAPAAPLPTVRSLVMDAWVTVTSHPRPADPSFPQAFFTTLNQSRPNRDPTLPTPRPSISHFTTQCKLVFLGPTLLGPSPPVAVLAVLLLIPTRPPAIDRDYPAQFKCILLSVLTLGFTCFFLRRHADPFAHPICPPPLATVFVALIFYYHALAIARSRCLHVDFLPGTLVLHYPNPPIPSSIPSHAIFWSLLTAPTPPLRLSRAVKYV